ncbi:DNA topoisomerase IB [Pontixanthobacter aestiaquae]|uniref:DNA topoisomerase n=1 Tax=Pontixanthobacter aestiaquae TaxID=1509367 RepID=A0A844ZE12_9SPHN|nr:DNA topoisomerase IB [Pontixanthobacter aestiaquae]MDN3644980.1 DNA topoisomerase IB [Pontixanthobacter aestiaquae]MXO84019.1 DNA topoisomerase IB [Pontixanthobacter aestiaquae]
MQDQKLIYVDDSLPGITRKGAGRGWAYYDPKGTLIRDRAEKTRLNAIALPPAYKDAWYCPAPNGHILATGYDDKGRKQYRYHPDFRTMKESEKFDGCVMFGKLLPLVRKRVEQDIVGNSASKERVLAAVVRLLDLGFVRIGNEAYKKRNKSFGASTLRDRHAQIDGDTLNIAFVGKGGKKRQVTLQDPELANAVQDARDVPGQHLFQYYDLDGQRQPIGSGDVNEYLRDTMGENFTAKNFRTWHASVLALGALANCRDHLTITTMCEGVAERLGNTPAITRKSYIHPAVISLVETQDKWRESTCMPRRTAYLSRHERALINLLEEAPSAQELLAA